MGTGPSSRLAGDLPPGWLPLSHAEALALVPTTELVALCDVEEAALVEGSHRYQVRSTFRDCEEMLRVARPTLVTVATRTPPKAAIVRAALRSGVQALYIEKPLATSVGAARTLLQECARSGTAVSYGVNRRFHTAYRVARQMVQDGVVGNVHDVSVDLGRAQLLWTHPHSADSILFMCGTTALESVQASLEPNLEIGNGLTIDCDPYVLHARFNFKNGIQASITRFAGHSIRVGGSDGVLTVHANGASIELRRRTAPSSPYFLMVDAFTPQPFESATVTALRELAAAAVLKQSPGISTDEIVVGTQMLMGCVWSHINGGRTVGIEEIPDTLTVSGRTGERYA